MVDQVSGHLKSCGLGPAVLLTAGQSITLADRISSKRLVTSNAPPLLRPSRRIHGGQSTRLAPLHALPRSNWKRKRRPRGRPALIQEEEYEETSLWNQHKKVGRMTDWKRLLLYMYKHADESLIFDRSFVAKKMVCCVGKNGD